MTSLLWCKTRVLALTELPTVPTGVLVAWVRSSSWCYSCLFCWKSNRLYPQDLWRRWQKEELFDLLTLFALWHYAIAIANFLLLPSVEAFIGTPWGAFIPHRDASHPGNWRTTSLRLRPLLWPMSRVLRKNQVIFWLTLLLLIPVSSILGSSLWLRTLDCLPFSVVFCEIFTGTASHTWNLREQNDDNSSWPEEYDKVDLRVVSFLHMAFDPIFRWLQESIIPKNPDNQRAYADDLAVASFSFRGLMTALAPAFRSVDSVDLNLNYRKCCWVYYGTEERDSLRTWTLENCEEFREMQFVRHAKSVGTMIGPDGHLHRWTARRKNSYKVCCKSMLRPKVWFSDCVTSRFMRFLCWVLLGLYEHPIRQPSRPRTMPFSP